MFKGDGAERTEAIRWQRETKRRESRTSEEAETQAHKSKDMNLLSHGQVQHNSDTYTGARFSREHRGGEGNEEQEKQPPNPNQKKKAQPKKRPYAGV